MDGGICSLKVYVCMAGFSTLYTIKGQRDEALSALPEEQAMEFSLGIVTLE